MKRVVKSGVKTVVNNVDIYRIRQDKDKILKDNIEKTEKTNQEKAKKYNKTIEIYNFNCPNLPQIQKLTEKRKKAINNFYKEFTEEQFIQICKKANKNSFLTGKNDRRWKADFDFIMRTDKAISILEGKYNDNNTKNNIDEMFKKMEEKIKNEN